MHASRVRRCRNYRILRIARLNKGRLNLHANKSPSSSVSCAWKLVFVDRLFSQELSSEGLRQCTELVANGQRSLTVGYGNTILHHAVPICAEFKKQQKPTPVFLSSIHSREGCCSSSISIHLRQEDSREQLPAVGRRPSRRVDAPSPRHSTAQVPLVRTSSTSGKLCLARITDSISEPSCTATRFTCPCWS